MTFKTWARSLKVSIPNSFIFSGRLSGKLAKREGVLSGASDGLVGNSKSARTGEGSNINPNTRGYTEILLTWNLFLAFKEMEECYYLNCV